MTSGPLRILIVRLSAVGDTVHGLPVLCALRDNLPNAHLSWVVEQRAASVLQGHAALDRLIVAPRRWLRSPMAVLAIAAAIAIRASADCDRSARIDETRDGGAALRRAGADRRRFARRTRIEHLAEQSIGESHRFATSSTAIWSCSDHWASRGRRRGSTCRVMPRTS